MLHILYYPKFKKTKKKVNKIYSGILKTIFFAISFFMTSLIVIAKPLFILIFTEKWLSAVPYFQLLALAGVLTPIHAFNLNIFKIYNRTDLFLKLGLIKVVMVAAALSIGVLFGIYGLLYAIVCSSILGILINTYPSEKLINYSTKQQLKDLFPIVMYAILSFLSGSLVLELVKKYHVVIQVLLGSTITSVIFVTSAIGTKSKSLVEVKYLINSILKRT